MKAQLHELVRQYLTREKYGLPDLQGTDTCKIYMSIVNGKWLRFICFTATANGILIGT